ncbi:MULTISPECIES: sulfatase family protein [Arenibacter]|uniref:sulfatase family protein n=1 Tax=Arenibacter TaxID=178469 RepID=UPI001EFCD233|nr:MULTISPECIES: sulfatase [Arenibacter]
MRFTNFYAAQAVCSASRAGLLTGCYPNRIGISGALFPNSEKGLNTNEITIAEMLKDKGYATAIFGKWHLGDAKPFLPLQHGFDEFTGLPYSNDMWPVDFEGKAISDTSNWRKKAFPPLPLIEGNEKVREIQTLEDQSELTTIYTEKAVDFIAKNKEKPFFLYVPHSMPHVPIAVSDKFKGKSKIGLYGDLMMELDWSVGQILKALKDNGLDENTLVIYTSDNGPWLNFGNHAGSSGGLREGKGTSWEGGQREPCIMRWPSVIPEGAICNNIASTLDILPTIKTITGGKLPSHKIDGVNIFPLLKGEVNANPRDHLYYYYGRNNLEAIRKDNWKLVFPHKHRSYRGSLPGNDGFPGSTIQADFNSIALYDLRRDPGEYYDVKVLYPEVVEELKQLAEVARKDLGDDLTGRTGENIRPAGSLID